MAFPFVKQLDSMQCGISCLSMICRFYGKKIPIRVLEQHCQPSKDGVSFKGIADLCEVLKLDYAAGRVSVTDLLSCPLPCILHWNQNHFVVLYKIDKNGKRFWIADPGKGKYKLTLEELMIVVGRTATDFVRRWLLLHISMRINISIVSDFFIKLLKLPMSFFETKLLGDLLQRMGDHSRIQNFLTNQVLGIMFTLLSFLIFGVILLFYDRVVFCIFLCVCIIHISEPTRPS
ncbi:MAG: hypothetical protein K2K05_08605 [Muribaculaceae bacterium]|nr:hypothetical protein [Muribaculaceae bacterium]